MKLFKYFPLFAIILISYNILAFWETGSQSTALSYNLFTIKLISGASVKLTVESFLIIAGLHVLYFNILKSTRSTVDTMISQSLSVTVFIVFVIQFIIVKRAGTAHFLILTLMSMLDVIGGFTVAVSTARRDVSITHE